MAWRSFVQVKVATTFFKLNMLHGDAVPKRPILISPDTPLEYALKYLSAGNKELFCNEFLRSLTDLEGIKRGIDASQDIDFQNLSLLYKIDQALNGVNRTSYWADIKKNAEEIIPKLPDDIKIVVTDLLPSTDTTDQNRIGRLQILKDKHRELPGLQYLLALALAYEATGKKDASLFEQSLSIFNQLAPYIVEYDNDRCFLFDRANISFAYIHHLQENNKTEQALEIVEDILSKRFFIETSYHSHFSTLSASLKGQVKGEKKIQESLQRAKDEIEKHRSKNEVRLIEILGIFFAIITISFSAFHIIPLQESLYHSFLLLSGVGLCLTFVLTFGLFLLGRDKKEYWIRGIAASMLLVSFTGLLYTSREQFSDLSYRAKHNVPIEESATNNEQSNSDGNENRANDTFSVSKQ